MNLKALTWKSVRRSLVWLGAIALLMLGSDVLRQNLGLWAGIVCLSLTVTEFVCFVVWRSQRIRDWSENAMAKALLWSVVWIGCLLLGGSIWQQRDQTAQVQAFNAEVQTLADSLFHAQHLIDSLVGRNQ